MYKRKLSSSSKDTESMKKHHLDDPLVYTKILTLNELVSLKIVATLCYPAFQISELDSHNRFSFDSDSDDSLFGGIHLRHCCQRQDDMDDEDADTFNRISELDSHNRFSFDSDSDDSFCSGIHSRNCCQQQDDMDDEDADTFNSNGKSDNEKNLHAYVITSLNRLPLPPTIQSTLKKYVGIAIFEVEKWVRYQKKRIFDRRKNLNLIVNLINLIIWKSDGEIDYRETAIKMLTNSRISELEKFKIICVYCLERNIKEVSPLEFADDLDKIILYDEPLVYYWYHSIKHDRSSLTEIQLLGEPKVDNIHAILYFWNSLDPNKQVDAAVSLIQKHRCSRFQKELLTKMDESQQYRVFMEIGSEVICNFVNEISCWEFGLSTWIRLRNLITKKQYKSIIMDLVNSESCWYRPNYFSSFSTFFNEMWKTTPDHLKRICLKNTKFVCRQSIIYSPVYFLFLVEILPEMPTSVRRDVFKKVTSLAQSEYKSIFEDLMVSDRMDGKHSLLDRFLKLCQLNSEEEVEFKKRWIPPHSIKNHCLKLLMKADWKSLEKFVAFYLPNVTDVALYKIHLLKSKNGIGEAVVLLSLKRVKRLEEIINHVFHQAEAAANFRKFFLLQEKVTNKCFHRWLVEGRIDYLRGFLNRFLSSEEHRMTVKKNIAWFYRFRKLGEIFLNLNELQWNEFLRWLLEDEKSLSRFKRSLNIHDIFSKLLKCGLSKKSNESQFHPVLDRFLAWYFESSEKIKKFKTEEIYNFTKIDGINDILQTRKAMRDSCYDGPLKSLLKWFFKEQPDEIYKFKSVYASFFPSFCNKYRYFLVFNNFPFYMEVYNLPNEYVLKYLPTQKLLIHNS